MYEAITIAKTLRQVLWSQKYICNYVRSLLHPNDINESMYFLNNQMCYLESNAELIKVSSSIEHLSAEKHP